MLNEKNPLASQALSDDDLDGVVGGASQYNGESYSTSSDIPSEVIKAVIDQRKKEGSRYLSEQTTCARCHTVYSSRALAQVSGWGLLCQRCALFVLNGLSFEDIT